MTFPLNEMYGYSRLCDRLRSSAIIWKQDSLRSSAIYDPRSSAIRDRLRSFAIIWKPALIEITTRGFSNPVFKNAVKFRITACLYHQLFVYYLWISFVSSNMFFFNLFLY